MRTVGTVLAALSLAVASAGDLWATPIRVNQLPNGNLISCSACHVNPGGGGTRNAFGQTVERSFLSGGNVVWGPALASLDSDGDGVTNGQELQDPHGQWVVGQPNPGAPNLVTRPGLATERQLRELGVHFTGMTPHVGQTLHLRQVSKATGREIGRASTTVAADFTANLNVPAGGSYWIDFFADHNSNGLYDDPPADHAWQLAADEVTANTTLDFQHNTNFANLDWSYTATVNLTGLMPHLNRCIEARVVDTATGREVGRHRVEVLTTTLLSFVIPGLAANGSYNLDFYADANNNGRYDAPPTDHAWRVPFATTGGNAIVDFSHNTNFTDIQWPYQFTLNLLGMNPHVGQPLELRVVNESNGEEVARVSREQLAVANSSISVPGIRPNTGYRADFYVDFNTNGLYDAPPADHAWRVTFNSGNSGNVVLNFTHNTNFTDIQWPALAADEPLPVGVLPAAYSLAQNYPNPFNPQTAIAFEMPAAGQATLKVFDLLGKEVATLVDGAMPAGRHTAYWYPQNLASGIYFYRLTAGNFTATKRLVLMK